MKKRGLLISCASIGLVLILAVVTLVGACAPEKPEKITLKIIYEQPWTDSGHVIFKEWQEKVNAAAPERLYIDYVGAYEVIPTFEQMEALMKGVIDLAVLAPTFYAGLCPETLFIQSLGSVTTVPEAREAGMIALLDELQREKLGVTALGALWSGDCHGILLKTRVDKADLTGLKIRALPVHQPAVTFLGGTTTLIPIEETYTALQTGLIDGIALPVVLFPDYKTAEMTDYIFFPVIPTSCWVPLNANAEVWDGLPEDVKKIMMDNLIELESKVDAYFGAMVKEIYDDLRVAGLEDCGVTSPAEEEELLKKMMQAQWETWIEKTGDPAWVPRLTAIAKPYLAKGARKVWK